MDERIDVDGGWLAVDVRDAGGDPVVLVPSLGRGAVDFDDLAGRLARAGYTAMAVNPRGIAGSSPVSPAALTLHDLAADVAVVAEVAGGPVHLAGHALGNRVVRCLAADRPDLVHTVTLLGAGGLVPPSAEASAHLARCFDLDRPDHLDDVAAAFFAPGNDASVWAGGWWPDAARAQAAAVERTARGDWWSAGQRAPVLVIQGVADVIAVPENGHRLAAALDGRARVVDLDDAGHALLPERPDEVGEAVLGFLRDHPRRLV
jgi:pimeloyl-ACP methyl ester carboxylesterase